MSDNASCRACGKINDHNTDSLFCVMTQRDDLRASRDAALARVAQVERDLDEARTHHRSEVGRLLKDMAELKADRLAALARVGVLEDSVAELEANADFYEKRMNEEVEAKCATERALERAWAELEGWDLPVVARLRLEAPEGMYRAALSSPPPHDGEGV